MKKTSLIGIAVLSSLALLSAALAASLEVQSEHVFTGERFGVLFQAGAPTSQHDLTITFQEQEKTISIPQKESGIFSQQVFFQAPDQPGEYTLKSAEGSLKITVEPALLVLEKVELQPGEVEPGDTAKLSFTVRNSGEFTVYNVNYNISFPRGTGMYELIDGQGSLGEKMEPEEEMKKVVGLKAGENAEGTALVKLLVSYEFDGEKHERTATREITVPGQPVLLYALIGVVFLLFLVLLLTERYKVKGGKRKSDKKEKS